MTSVPQKKAFPIKTMVIWVLGICSNCLEGIASGTVKVESLTPLGPWIVNFPCLRFGFETSSVENGKSLK